MRPWHIAWIPLVIACASRPAVRAEGPLARLAFMTGCWRGSDGAGTVEERIGPADANIMLSTSRTLEGGRVASFEFLQFEARPGTIVLIPYLNGRRAGEFTLKPGDDGVAVFEDPQHDFPKRVIYRKDGDGLRARVEGDPGDKERAQEWAMRRCAE
jgi:hypothetical protein